MERRHKRQERKSKGRKWRERASRFFFGERERRHDDGPTTTTTVKEGGFLYFSKSPFLAQIPKKKKRGPEQKMRGVYHDVDGIHAWAL